MRGSREIKQKFKSSIRRGTGEVYLLIRDYPTVDFSKEITQACLKNFAYDGQCESSRASYLYELMLQSGSAEQIKPAILNSLTLDQKDTWSLVQLFKLTKLYAKDGYIEAKAAIYNRFLKYPSAANDWAGYSEIIDLDGVDGLKFVASKMGQALQDNSDNWQDDNPVRYFQNKNPEINAWKELENEATNNPFIKIYLDNVRRRADRIGSKSILEKITYANAVEEVLLTKSRVKISYRNWTKKELILIGERLIVEKNKQNKAKLLRVFRNNIFPLNSSFILDIAKGKTTTDISYLAFDVLGLLKNSKVRNFAIDGMSNSKNPQKFTIILKANYKAGDYEKLTEIVNNTKNEVLLELLMTNLIEIYEYNKSKECAKPLEALYNKSNCAMHRYDLIKLLIETDVLPLKIKSEMIFDCNDKIKELTQNIVA